jgi:hypothetical protein
MRLTDAVATDRSASPSASPQFVILPTSSSGDGRRRPAAVAAVGLNHGRVDGIESTDGRGQLSTGAGETLGSREHDAGCRRPQVSPALVVRSEHGRYVGGTDDKVCASFRPASCKP